MAAQHILVVEDEENISELIRYNLEREGYKVQVCARGDDGLKVAQENTPDLIILDLMLPGMDGLDVCKELRREKTTHLIPVIVLTAKGEEMDKIIGLELGADDYMTKPFSPRELAARIKALLRRCSYSAESTEEFKIGALHVDPARHLVVVEDRQIQLTSKEFHLLHALLEANGRVLSRDFLLDRVWGYDQAMNIETRTIDMHIGQLRKKIKPESDRIVTVKNEGYRFNNKTD